MVGVTAWGGSGVGAGETGALLKFSASLGPIVAKKVLMWSGVFSWAMGVPCWSLRVMFALGGAFLIRQLISVQNFLGSSFRFSNFSFMKSARALRIAFLDSVLSLRALGRSWGLLFSYASKKVESRSAISSRISLVTQGGCSKRVWILFFGQYLLAQLLIIFSKASHMRSTSLSSKIKPVSREE